MANSWGLIYGFFCDKIGSLERMARDMATLAAELRDKLRRKPGATVNLIVRTKGDPNVHATALEASGMKVRRTFSLISGLAIQGPASAALDLAREPWVESIEEDKPVHTMAG